MYLPRENMSLPSHVQLNDDRSLCKGECDPRCASLRSGAVSDSAAVFQDTRAPDPARWRGDAPRTMRRTCLRPTPPEVRGQALQAVLKARAPRPQGCHSNLCADRSVFDIKVP